MKMLALIAALSVATVFGISSAHAEHSKVGTLDCDVSAGIGVIVGSKQDVKCTFNPSEGGAAEKYVGSISEFGLDIGTVDKGKMTWLVYNATGQAKDALAGTYRGATADAALGLGGGVNVLVGGNHDSLSLQPLSIEGDEGLNLAVGVAALTLRPAA